MFAVVDDQEDFATGQVFDQGFQCRPTDRPETEGGGYHVDQQQRVAQLGQLDQPDTIGVAPLQGVGGP
nr:hypothetical protein [Nocardia zapadnayensis]